VAFDRLGLLRAPVGDVDPAQVAAALAELARVGVRVTGPALLSADAVRAIPGVVEHVRLRRGQRGVYSPLFAGFPDDLPTFDDVHLRAVLGAVRLAGVVDPSEQDLRQAFDFSTLDWWPASSVPQDVDATLVARARQEVLPRDVRTEWWTVRTVRPHELDDAVRAWMADALATPTSLRDDVREDLAALVEVLGVDHVDPATIRFRETRTLVARLVWETDRASLPRLRLTPDDLLRLFADLTGTDVSLGSTARYPRLTRADRRVVVACLEGSDRLADVFRRRGLWLAVARGLHLAEHDAPRTAAVFARLRAGRHDRSAFGSRFELALRDDPTSALVVAADEAPGVLVRQLRRLASLAGDDDARHTALLAALHDAAPRVPVRLLLVARAQLRDNGATYPRVAVTKKGTPLPIDRAAGHLALADDRRDALVDALTAAVRDHLRSKGSWAGERIHVAPGLDRILVPEGLRSTSPGVVQVERGSVLPLGDADVVRLFVHWKHPHSDLDLSCLVLDDDFQVVDQVSWTRLRAGAMVHSGDITSAPAGAEEFLDIDLRALSAPHVEPARPWWRPALGRRPAPVPLARWRYLAPVVFRYAGPPFDQLDEVCAGWMLRDSPSRTAAAFDPATVANAFGLAGARRSAVVFVLDVRTREVTYVDLSVAGAGRARAERDGSSIGALVRAVTERRSTRTDVAALVAEHVAARGGEIVRDASQATITVGVDRGCTYDVLHPEKLLADLL
jgi:hypothetical protein